MFHFDLTVLHQQEAVNLCCNVLRKSKGGTLDPQPECRGTKAQPLFLKHHRLLEYKVQGKKRREEKEVSHQQKAAAAGAPASLSANICHDAGSNEQTADKS